MRFVHLKLRGDMAQQQLLFVPTVSGKFVLA
jgi:hypothetical protein